jgi:parallel beta-helix repeat protein
VPVTSRFPARAARPACPFQLAEEGPAAMPPAGRTPEVALSAPALRFRQQAWPFRRGILSIKGETSMPILRHLLAAVLVFGSLCLLPGSARAETYDTCTGFIDSLPTTINTQGTWCLRGNLSTAINSGKAITIATNNVTIDCNNFKIGGLGAGLGTFAEGIGASARSNATIRNCNIRGFRLGINLDGASGGNHLVEDNLLDSNTFVGIAVDGDGSMVRGNVVSDTGGTTLTADTRAWGIVTSGTVDIIDNTVSNVVSYQASGSATATGIGAFVNAGGAIQRNRVRGLVPGPAAGADQQGIASINVGSHPEISDNVIVGTGVDGLTDTGVYCNGPGAAALAYNNRILRFGAGTAVSSNCIDAGNIAAGAP